MRWMQPSTADLPPVHAWTMTGNSRKPSKRPPIATEQKHFSKEAELEGLIASSPDNLRNSIDEEAKEVERFTEFARQATEDGDLGIASVFEQISHDKAERRARFEAVLADMGVHSNPQTITA